MLKKEKNEKGEKGIAFLISIFFLLFYLFTQTTSIYGGDSGDLVSAALTFGVAHPPGYPLYTFLGWLTTHIPFSTIAWRVGLLSIIPASVTLGILYLVIHKFVQKRLVALITVFCLGFTYLYWLYAIVAEVFALHLLFVVSILYILIRFKETQNIRFLHWASFIFGLSLTHHHTILFLVPGYFFLIFKELRLLKNKFKIFSLCFVNILFGLLPYIYVVWAAHSGSPINWENPQNLSGFWRLVTRAIYGTFRSGSTFGLSPTGRYQQLLLMNETFFIDFTRLGIVLGVIGAVTQFLKDRNNFWRIGFFFLLSGPLFIFYAGFPAILNFYLGVVERFLLVPYLFFTIWIAYGIKVTARFIDLLIRTSIKRPFLVSSSFLFFLFPALLLTTNWSKILPLKHDRTAENVARDILKTTPDGAILFLSDDTSVFNTQYLYFSTGGPTSWRGIKLIQFGTFGFGFYDPVLTDYYKLNWSSKNSQNPVKDFIQEQYPHNPIISGLRIDLGQDYTWVPMGLLYRLYKTEELKTFTLDEYRDINESLFTSYQDPLSGALGKYMHVMLADSVRVYANARREVGKILLKLGDAKLSETYFREAIRFQPEVTENQIDLATSLLLQKKCEEAENILQTAMHNDPGFPALYQLLASIYKDCFKNEVKAEEYVEKYQEVLKESQIPLSKF